MERGLTMAVWLAQAGGVGNDFGWAGSPVLDYLKLMAILAVVLAAAFAGLRLWLPKIAGMRRISNGPIRVAARMTLEPGKNLYIIEAAGGAFLVGTSNSGVHFLTPLDAEHVEAAAESAPATGLEFAGLINAFKRGRQSR
jgi:hypothetical protein